MYFEIEMEIEMNNKILEKFLASLTRMLESTAALHEAETKAVLAQLEKGDKQKDAEDKTCKGSMRSPFGYCQECLSLGVNRDKSGTDTCSNRHVYPSSTALTPVDAMREGLKRKRKRRTQERVVEGPECNRSEEKVDENG